jgi:predicted RND superfamily exporter protein
VLCPALLAAGLTSLLLLVIDLELSPLGAALEPLVLAVGLEFGMLLDMRYREARAAGHEPAAAREHTTREIVPAVMLSASTVAVGFGVLCASRMPLLSQLGWLVALELALCLLAALVVVPALAERLDRNHIGGADIHVPLFAERLARRLRAAGARKVA